MDELKALVCDENSKDLCIDYENNDDDPIGSEVSNQTDDDDLVTILERESEYLPDPDYLPRLRSGDLVVTRTEAFLWISKAHCYYSFGPLSLCLAVNYLDRFLSLRHLPRDKDWTVQLLAVACLSIAAKMEETSVPPALELQVGDPKYVFEAKTIQRMELLVLDTLKWKMNAITPCSLLHYSLKKLRNPDSITDKYLFSTTKVVNRAMQLILCTIKGVDYLEFKASEVAAGAALCVSAEIQAVVDIDKASSCFVHLNKGRVLKCVEMIKEMSMQQRAPQSPIGVLDAACFSIKTDTSTTINMTMTTTTETKRMKLDPAK